MIATRIGEAGNHRRPRGTRWNGLLTGVLSLLLFAAPPATRATAPTLPIEFEDEALEPDRQILTLFFDPKQVADLKVERQLYRGGQRTASDRVEVKAVRARGERPGMMVELPLRFQGIERLPDGAVAQKIVVEARRVSESSRALPPLRLERWAYFLISKGHVRRLSMEEYSILTDPAEVAVDVNGRHILITRGGDVKLDVPLDRTKGQPAGMVGREGGLVPEQPPPPYRKKPPAERDMSEREEK